MGSNQLAAALFLTLFTLQPGVIFAEAASTTASSPKSEPVNDSSEKTILDQEVVDHRKVENHPGLINLYRPNYVLPYYYTGRPYQTIYIDNTPNNQPLKHEELKAQLSLLVPLIHHLWKDKPLSLDFAYTQLMYWQVYAKSQYFRETNYEPELFVENYFNSHFAGQIGVNHQSNGRGGYLERSWNRGYMQAKFSDNQWLATIRGWFLFAEQKSSTLHNPDIAYYLGYENVLFSYKLGQAKASLELQNLESGLRRGFIQATLSYPILKSVSIYTQFFTGYGQSLIEYNHKTTSAGIGIALNDWIT